MEIDRRGFFATLAGAAAVSFDPERALWTPGRKTYFIPSGPIRLPDYRGPVFEPEVLDRVRPGWQRNGTLYIGPELFEDKPALHAFLDAIRQHQLDRARA